MNGDWETANLWLSRFLATIKMGIISCKNPYIDEYIETMDSGLMTTAKFIDLIDETRAILIRTKDNSAGLPMTLKLLLCDCDRHNTFLKLITNQGSRYWYESSLAINKKCGVIT
jgi:hypothetical protein